MTEENDGGQDLMIPEGFGGVMERPKSLDPNDRTGTEGIMNEIKLPRLTVAQGLSPELTETNSNFISGLKINDLFNNMTGEVYGRGPLVFVPIRHEWKAIEFIPRAEGGGIRDMNVPKGDPRLEWTTVNNVRTPPVATQFLEFPSLLLRPGKAPEPVVISFKLTNKWVARSANQLKIFIGARSAPIYAGLYTIESKPQTNTKGTFGVLIPKNAGWVPKDTPAGAKLFDLAQSLAKGWEGKRIAVDETMAPGAGDFDPEELERQSAANAAATGTQTDM